MLDPTSSSARIHILDEIIKHFNPSQDPIKKDYQGCFQDAEIQRKTGDVLAGSINCWWFLLDLFLTEKEKIAEMNQKVVALEQSIQDELIISLTLVLNDDNVGDCFTYWSDSCSLFVLLK